MCLRPSPIPSRPDLTARATSEHYSNGWMRTM